MQTMSAIRRRFKTGTQDEIWLPVAGRERWLVFSCNKAILTVTKLSARYLSGRRSVAVFLTTGQEKKLEILKLILRKWSWLEAIDE